MSVQNLVCPTCKLALSVPASIAFQGQCPRCSARFLVEAGNVRAMAPLPHAASSQSGAPARAGMHTPAPPNPSPRQAALAGRNWKRALLLGLLSAGILTSLVIVLVALNNGGDKPDPTPPDVDPIAKASDVKVLPDPAWDKLAAPPKLSEPHPGVDHVAVNAAIDKGVQSLRRYLAKKVVGKPTEMELGVRGLLGFTLLSCNVPKDDPDVLALADLIRRETPTLARTYELSTCIWFLDRLSDPRDKDLIRSLALRLVAGQRYRGGWDYTVTLLTPQHEQDLLKLLEDQSLARPPLPKEKGKPIKKKLVGELEDLPVFRYTPGVKVESFTSIGHEDNSLTQFALLALWRAKTYGIPVDRSLAFAEARFHESQLKGGVWSYGWDRVARNADSMTCAGLMGLAVGKASQLELLAKLGKEVPKSKGPDPAVTEGLNHLGRRLMVLGKGKTRPGVVGVGASSNGDLYFLWSLERMALVYDLKTIGDTDWYAWGVPFVLKSQNPDGDWLSTKADTCFALLFLRRANIAQDLTEALQKVNVGKGVGERKK